MPQCRSATIHEFAALQAKQLMQQGLLKMQMERMTQGVGGVPGPDQAKELIRVLDDMLDLKKAGNE